MLIGTSLPPDDAKRRLWWELPLAAALLIALWLLASIWLNQPAKTPPPAPIDARIYELPPKATSGPKRPADSTSTPARPAPPLQKQAPASKAAPSSAPRRVVPPAVQTAPVPKSAPSSRPSPHAETSKPVSPAGNRGRSSNWAALSAQMNSVASSVIGHSQFAQIHDPNTLIARYYLESVLEKLQRVGDMIYTGSQVGRVDVRLIIGADGTVKVLELNPKAGALGLEAVASQIVNLSAPFAPFPSQLLRHTQRLKLTIHMDFLGYRDVAPTY